MNQVYEILDGIRDHFRNNEITETVSFGELNLTDADKTTVFPLAHIDIGELTYDVGVAVFKIRVLVLDNLKVNKAVESVDEFWGNDDLHDVYNTQFIVITQLINSLRRGDLYEAGIRLYEEPTVQPFEDRFGNMLAGWLTEIDIQIKNDISVC